MKSKTKISIPGIWTLGLLVALIVSGTQGARGQDTPPATGGTPDATSQPQEPVPAYGQENPAPAVTENPPLSGLDTPNLEPHAAPLSYLQPGATVSESADTNLANTLGSGQTASLSRALGSLTLKRLWSHYDLALDYVGGVGYYDLPDEGFKALQQMDFEQKITWKRGELGVRDSFSYLPEGNFGGAYGSLGSQGIESLGNSAFSTFWGGSALGTLGLAPRILDVSLVDLSEYLSPKSAITAAAGYGVTHFFGDDVATGTPFVGSSQLSAQVGYSHVLSPQTQVAAMYGYQAFDFSVSGTAFHSHIIQLMYGHRITGRMDFLIAAGPQFTFIGVASEVCSDPTVPVFLCTSAGDTLKPTTIEDDRIGAAGRIRLRYKFTKTDVEAQYERFDTSGSGLFAGAQSDIARLGATRPLSRVWTVSADLGYSRNVRLQPASEGINAERYTYGFAGMAVHRSFGHNWHAFGSYQFNELAFDNSFCGTSGTCGRISNRNVFTIGLDWIPRPIRLD